MSTKLYAYETNGGMYNCCRPLDVKLAVADSCSDIVVEAIERLQGNLPSEHDLVSIQRRTKRFLALIENILVQHELLAMEAIRTLRTIRRIVKWTSMSLSIFLAYLFIRKFYSQSAAYRIVSENRNKLLLVVGFLGLAIYRYRRGRVSWQTFSFIS